MSSSQVKVLGSWPSPYVMRARIALNIKGVEYEFLEETFGSKSDLLLKSNPVYKKMPVLIHGDNPICESSIIVHYIDEVWASEPNILPSLPYDRAIARFWATYIDDKWWSSAKGVLSAEGDIAKHAALEEAKQGLVLLEEALVKSSNGKKFFGGDKIGYLDIALGCFLAWTRAIDKMANVSLIDETKTPNLFKWAQDFSSDVAVKDVLPETDKVVEFAKILAAKMKGHGKN